MTESFPELLERSMRSVDIYPGSVVKGCILLISRDTVVVDTGLKSESSVPAEQFRDDLGKLEIEVGDCVDFVLDAMEDGFGETLLSREKAKKREVWSMLERAHREMDNVSGSISGRVKGGFTVELHGVRAFLPGSLLDINPNNIPESLGELKLDFRIIKLDKRRGNVVVSRRATSGSRFGSGRDEVIKRLQNADEISGTVKNLTDYGAFVDLGGVDGLLHITDMSWKRIKHPSEVVNIGEKIKVKILKLDVENMRISLGLKQLGDDPWKDIGQRYPEKTKLSGRVTNIADYGCFVEIEDGIEGLVHVSEMDWSARNVHPSKIVKTGESVEVMVLRVDEERRRISLGIKQCRANPWRKFSEKYGRGDLVEGRIKSITNFGIFVGLEGNIDGLVHLSDVSWGDDVRKKIDSYSKGDKICAVVLQIDAVRERISLGIKQLGEDPVLSYFDSHGKEEVIEGTVSSISPARIEVRLTDVVSGTLRMRESSTGSRSAEPCKIGDKILVRMVNFDRKNRTIYLSHQKERDLDEMDKRLAHDDGTRGESFSSVMTAAFQAATREEEC